MIEKIDLDKEPFDFTEEDAFRRATIKPRDTLNRLHIIAEKLNEVIDAINQAECCISPVNVSTHNMGDIPTCTCNQHKRGEITTSWSYF